MLDLTEAQVAVVVALEKVIQIQMQVEVETHLL
jgi:hypothetical protein